MGVVREFGVSEDGEAILFTSKSDVFILNGDTGETCKREKKRGGGGGGKE